MQEQNMSAVEWLVEQIKLKYDLDLYHVKKEIEQAKEMEVNKNAWKLVDEEIPPSDVELLVKSPNGIVHLAYWRPLYDIFTCQDKRESSLDWKWKLI
jgi:hypothetical protein